MQTWLRVSACVSKTFQVALTVYKFFGACAMHTSVCCPQTSVFGCWILPEKFSFCPKNSGFARVWEGGCSPLIPWLVCHRSLTTADPLPARNMTNRPTAPVGWMFISIRLTDVFAPRVSRCTRARQYFSIVRNDVIRQTPCRRKARMTSMRAGVVASCVGD